MDTERQLNEIGYIMVLAANQLAKDGHDELAHDLDDMRARLLAIRKVGSDDVLDVIGAKPEFRGFLDGLMGG